MALVKAILWNDDESRLRAGWRLGVHLILNLGLIVLLTLPLGFSYGGELAKEHPLIDIAIAVLRVCATVLSLWLAARFLDRRYVGDFGLHFSASWWTDLGFGFVLAGSLVSLMRLIGLMAGWATITSTFQSGIEGISFPVAIVLAFVLYACVGIYEELFSRGYHLKNLSEGFHFPSFGSKRAIALAVLLSSTFFAVLHVGSYGLDILTMLDLLLGGVVLALGVLLTGELAIPIGFHIAYNFFLFHVFGVGNQGAVTAFIVIETKNRVLASGEVLDIGVTLGAVLFILLWVRWRYGEVRLHEELASARLLHQQ